MKKLMMLFIGMAMLAVSGMASAWEGIYKQVPVDPQGVKVVNTFAYYGRNPTEERFFVVQRLGEFVVMESLKADGTTWEAFSGVPDGKWVDDFKMVISSETASAKAILEEVSPTELTLYMYWCRQSTVAENVPTLVEEWDGQGIYERSVEPADVGCYVPSRQYINLERIN